MKGESERPDQQAERKARAIPFGPGRPLGDRNRRNCGVRHEASRAARRREPPASCKAQSVRAEVYWTAVSCNTKQLRLALRILSQVDCASASDRAVKRAR